MHTALPLAAYRAAISLGEPFLPTADGHVPIVSVRTVLALLSKDPAAMAIGLRLADVHQLDDVAARRLLRAVLTVRQPEPLPAEIAALLDALLAAERTARDIIEVDALPSVGEMFAQPRYPSADRMVLWQGDITTLGADAIVNAANNALLGCFVPMHRCIDNAIHAAAGPRLRDDCHTIMTMQGHPEPTGTAKITRGYHLPARYVLHTVGPIVEGPLRPEHQRALASAYQACLDLAAEVTDLRTVAFCGISTGVFGYPKAAAARVAVHTVADWLDRRPERLDRVVFNVYADDDRAAYLSALADGARTR